MKTNLSFLTLLFCVGTALAQNFQQVLPGGLANVEGNSSLAEPFNSPSFRFQQVFAASEFAYLGPGTTARVDLITFRIDGASASQVALFFGGSSVALSSTQRGVDELSQVFADNLGSDAVSVWSGALSLGSFAQPGAMPQAWQFQGSIPVTTPFYYNPAMGNLLLDIVAAGGRAFLPGALDAQNIAGDSVSTLFALDGNSSIGIADTRGLVVRFDITIVPEPDTWLLVTAAAAALFAVRRWNCFGPKLSARDARRLVKFPNLRARPKA